MAVAGVAHQKISVVGMINNFEETKQSRAGAWEVPKLFFGLVC